MLWGDSLEAWANTGRLRWHEILIEQSERSQSLWQ